MILVEILLFIVGFVFLIKGADLLVKGASSIALQKNVPQIVIGLTIVSFGTSTPELVVNVLASLGGNSEITIGNVVGSNIANILLILGISGLIYPLHTKKNTVWKEIPIALLSSLVLLVLANDAFLLSGVNLISAGDGLILLLFFCVFMGYVFAIMKENNDPVTEIESLPVKKSTIFIIAGIAGLTFGGKLIVDSAVSIAQMLKVSEAVIGFTLVAVGTSLPELATSAVAAYRKNSDIAIGNVVGSNIFNVFLILGISSVINPIQFNNNLNIDLLFLVFISLLLFFFMFTGKKRILDRWEGALFVVLYFGYLLRFFLLET
ncbi:MAG: calcium/sodium antiporter [Melioribacteraceae bacterium]|nr:calcium/sodium antiporter [Melioribacteraceae bacterium]